MSVKFMQGDMFDSDATITITVNCVGAMGKGIAKQAKDTIPGLYDYYRILIDNRKIKPGKPILLPKFDVLLFPTKLHWRNDSKIEWIDEGLKRIHNNHSKLDSLALPPIGCGNGNLDWDKVLNLIHFYLDDIELEVEVYSPK